MNRSHNIFDPEKEARWWWPKIIFYTRMYVVLSALLISAFAYFIYDLRGRVAFYYVFIDALFSLIYLPHIWPAGLRTIITYLTLSSLWVAALWQVAPYACAWIERLN
ncbi:hypothetical protein GCM10011273_00450 [Asticcacaulis endophyticus]|uniref:Uncharacterized protein n=1 Tax=Asticcacaulis endophyticus TaxID=1395890 RepID=A0A918PR05_9CAUL|nr:hypothetical protein GCM10011273_00450 [Asticcacaulis endophyticus]